MLELRMLAKSHGLNVGRIELAAGKASGKTQQSSASVADQAGDSLEKRIGGKYPRQGV
jgi:hypothetical protein